jgi:1-deoxy-D-xylulose-5-phosphate synthase
MAILKSIRGPNDLKDLTLEQLHVLAREIREKIINTCAQTGGHVAPSLGVVELTIALYRAFDADVDKIIWDVGHQTYAQKLITGRYSKFHTIRKYKGISGFPKRKESKYDVFDTGHSSTSLSAAAGFVLARDLKGDNSQIISVIGDGSLGAGIAFEALNHLGHLKKDVIVILNDNERSIGDTVGALSQYLTRVITTRTYNRFRDDLWKFLGKFPPYTRDRSRNLAKLLQEGLKGLYAPAVIFEELGFRYIGPLNGHKLGEMIDTFERVKEMKGPKIIHVVTKKGKGFEAAEKYPEAFHGIGPYCPKTGKVKSNAQSWTSIFGDTVVNLAKRNKKIVAITAGMCLGTGLRKFREEIPERFFDVGITEQHAVTMAAALAMEGYIPICAIYSTFLQRAYDQVIHDVCLQDLPVIFAVDRAGLVGQDGPTHHGPFDLSYFRCIPNMIIGAPKDGSELVAMLRTAVTERKHPFAIRYPRGVCTLVEENVPQTLPVGKWEVLKKGRDIAVIAIGSMVKESIGAHAFLEKKGISPMIINGRFVKPIDSEMLQKLQSSVHTIVTVEENTLSGGFGSAIMEYCSTSKAPVKVYCIGLPDNFIEHGSRDVLLDITGLNAKGIADRITSFL